MSSGSEHRNTDKERNCVIWARCAVVRVRSVAGDLEPSSLWTAHTHTDFIHPQLNTPKPNPSPPANQLKVKWLNIVACVVVVFEHYKLDLSSSKIEFREPDVNAHHTTHKYKWQGAPKSYARKILPHSLSQSSFGPTQLSIGTGKLHNIAHNVCRCHLMPLLLLSESLRENGQKAQGLLLLFCRHRRSIADVGRSSSSKTQNHLTLCRTFDLTLDFHSHTTVT